MPVSKPADALPGWPQERRAVSREMHDHVGHLLLSVLNNLDLLELSHDLGWAEEQQRLARTRQSAREALEAVRALCARLRGPADAGPPRPEPWPGWTREIGIDSPAGYKQLFLVLREAVHNAIAHSRAKQVRVDLTLAGGRITAMIEDDGDGFEPQILRPSERIGLDSMSERIDLLGGSFDIVSGRGEGTTVKVVLPVRGAPAAHG